MRAEGCGFKERGETRWCGVGQRLDEDRVDEAEYGDGGADAEGEDSGGGDGEAFAAAELARGEAEILKKIFEEREGAGFALRLASVFDAAEMEDGLTAGFGGRHAGAEIVFDVEIEVGGEFGVEVGFTAGV